MGVKVDSMVIEYFLKASTLDRVECNNVIWKTLKNALLLSLFISYKSQVSLLPQINN